jgi:hypothetical protein
MINKMGGAYAKGYVKAILDYAKTHKIEGVLIGFEADFAPFGPRKQKAIKVKNMGLTYQYAHKDDNVAGDDQEPGVEKEDTKSDKDQIHSIFSFFNQIKNLPVGTCQVINGQIVPDKK